MKTLLLFTRNVGSWKAIAFLAAVISMTFCSSCEEEVPLIKARVVISATQNITDTSATIIATIVPNQNNTEVILRYRVSGAYQGVGSDWKTQMLPEKISGTEPREVVFNVSDLKPFTYYNFEVIATNAAGSEIVRGTTFSTLKPELLVVKIQKIYDIAVNSAMVSISISSNKNLRSARIEYQVKNSDWISKNLVAEFINKDTAELILSDLDPGTDYNVQAIAENKNGVAVSAVVSFKTYADIVTDYDGNKYWAVKIGDQIWLESNLRTKHFLNGDPIPNVQPNAEWLGMRSPAWCYTKNDPVLGGIYGCLYNNYVGLDPRGLIAGYHTPSIQEYETLVGYLDGGTIAPRKLKSATDDWYNGEKGDNSSGFNALPGGWRSDKENTFTNTLYYQASFQTTTPMEGVGAYYGATIYYTSNRAVMTVGASPEFLGRSIRLIKN